MARLSSKARKSLPASEFGMSGSRKYPMPDRSHAANAKARASQAEHAGRISQSTEDKIDAKANRVLGEGQYRGAGRRGHNAKSKAGKTRSWTGK